MDSAAAPTSDGSLSSADRATIAIRLGSLDALWNELDPAPPPVRSLAPRVESYLLERVESGAGARCAPIEVRVSAEGVRRAAEVREAVRVCLLRAASRQDLERRRIIASGLRGLLAGMILALVLVAAAQTMAELSELRFVRAAANGISIVVWVILWRPVERLIHDWREPAMLRDMYARQADAAISVVEDTANGGPAPPVARERGTRHG